MNNFEDHLERMGVTRAELSSTIDHLVNHRKKSMHLKCPNGFVTVSLPLKVYIKIWYLYIIQKYWVK